MSQARQLEVAADLWEKTAGPELRAALDPLKLFPPNPIQGVIFWGVYFNFYKLPPAAKIEEKRKKVFARLADKFPSLPWDTDPKLPYDSTYSAIYFKLETAGKERVCVYEWRVGVIAHLSDKRMLTILLREIGVRADLDEKWSRVDRPALELLSKKTAKIATDAKLRELGGFTAASKGGRTQV